MKRWAMGLALLLGVGIHAAQALDTKGLVLYLPLDEGTGKVANDISGTGNHGALTGDVQWVTGKHGKAAMVSDAAAGNMIVVKHHASLQAKGALTLAAWAKVDTAPDSHVSIITKADTWMIHVSNWQGPGLEWEPLYWTPDFVAWQTKASKNVPMKEWHHIVGVFDGTNVINYIDGKEAGRVAQKGEVKVSTVDVVIGRDSRGCCAARKSTMTVDDVMVFTRAVTAAEAGEIMNYTPTAVEPSGKLAAMWAQVKSQ